MAESVNLSVDARGVARITLARADRHNALLPEMMDAVASAAEGLAREAQVRVVILDAEGPTFCAGGDLGWMQAQMQADRQGREVEARRLARMLQALDRIPQPLLAEVQGPAYGGGVGLLAVCDIAVGVETASFVLSETRLGLIPATIGPYVVARIGLPAARRAILGARRFDAPEAVAMGLLARMVPAEWLRDAVEEEVGQLLACAPGAVADAKAFLRSLAPSVDDGVVDSSVEALLGRWETEEAREGTSAFFARRPPSWQVAAEKD